MLANLRARYMYRIAQDGPSPEKGLYLSKLVLPLEIYWDVSHSVIPQTLWCFEVFGSYYSLGLVLVLNDKAVYERIGYFGHTSKKGVSVMESFFAENDPKTITIC